MKSHFFDTLTNLRWNFILNIYNYAMNLEILQNKKNECRTWKNVEPWYLQLLESFKIKKNNLNIEKVRIEELMELLSFVKEQGFDFVDLIGIPGETEQSLGVLTQSNYKHEEETEIPETNIKLSEINLNDLI